MIDVLTEGIDEVQIISVQRVINAVNLVNHGDDDGGTHPYILANDK